MTVGETKQVEFDLKNASVMIAIPVNRDLPWQTARSLMETCIRFANTGLNFDVQFVVGSSIIECARSKVADVFLKGKCQHLFMIDSDQTWTPDAAIRMLALSTKMDVVCGAYPAKHDPPTFLLNPEDCEVETNEWGCLPLKGLGLGFTIVQRHVMEELADRAPKLTFPDSDDSIAHIFRCDIVDGAFRGEDMAFFADVRALGYTVWVDPTIEIGHVGAKEYRGKLTDAIAAVPLHARPLAKAA